MRHKHLALTLSSSLLLLSACQGAPVGWGGTHEIIHSNDSSVTITYDKYTESYKDVFNVALDYCQSIGKDLGDSKKIGQENKMMPTLRFDCE